MKFPAFFMGLIAPFRAFFKHLKLFSATSLAIFIGLGLGCSPNISNVIDKQTASETHVAFAGGGWRAHTGHSGWVMSLLQVNNQNRGGCPLNKITGNPDCLAYAFRNVKTIAANSGGSWFSTMLMYDADFINQITSSKALNFWGSPDNSNPLRGWLGRQENRFKDFSGQCHKKYDSEYLECVLTSYFNVNPNKAITSEAIPSWPKFVEAVVYDGYKPRSYGNLNSTTHQIWAKNKSLLMAGSLLTNNVLLNDQNAETYYQACIGPRQVVTEGDSGGYCTLNNRKISIPDALPVTFTSLAENDLALKTPSFFSNTPNKFSLGYSGTKFDVFGRLHTGTATINTGNIKTDYIPVLAAATASSAAAGFAASQTVSKQYKWHIFSVCSVWDCPWHLRDLALGFNKVSSSEQMSYVPNANLDNKDVATLASESMIRVADGGVVDNSGIIQLIGYLQKNNLADDFTIVAFDEVTSNDAKTDSTLYPSSDISYLFNGAPNNEIKFGSYSLTVPDLAVLQTDHRQVVKHSWTVVDASGNATKDKLHYYEYPVTTIKNDHFNIAAGKSGTLLVFSSEFKKAGTAPDNKGSFGVYNSMIQNFYPTLKKKPDDNPNALTGLQYLKSAFGL